MKFFPVLLCLAFLPVYSFAVDESSVTGTSTATETQNQTEAVVEPEAKKVLDQISANISRGRGEFKSCGRFKKKFKKIISGGLNIDSASHHSKQQALDYLAALEKYPEPSKGFAKALDLFHENIDLLLKVQSQEELFGKLNLIEDECVMFSMLVHASLLFKDVKAFDFSKKEKAKVEKLAKKYLSIGLPIRTLVEVGVKGAALKIYLESLYSGENRDALLARAGELMKSFELHRSGDLERAKQVKAEGKNGTLEFHRFQWAKARELSATYEALVKDSSL